AGDIVQAEQYADLLEAGGAADHAHLLKGEIALARDGFTQALAHFNRIRDQGALRLQAAFLSGKCLLSLRNLRESERALLFVLDQQPDHVEAHRLLAIIYYDQ